MKKEPDYFRRLIQAGISVEDCCALRRISMTLRRWHELECGTTGARPDVTLSVERDGDEEDSKPYMRIQYPTREGYIDRRWRTQDRENGAKKRLVKIMAKYSALKPYIQTDPRGCALYILRPGDVPEGQEAMAYYTNGIAVY